MSNKIEMARIPSGTFIMGHDYVNDPALDEKVNVFYHNEQPVHQVTLDAFQIGTTPITQAQYEAVTGENPSTFAGDSDAPVTNVSAQDAMRFCNKLSIAEGLSPCYDDETLVCDYTLNGYRLPTEAEWEFACKSGTDTLFNTGNSETDLANAGWYLGNSGDKPRPVAQKKPNAFGLYDMHGNVWEWCRDWYDEKFYAKAKNINPENTTEAKTRVLRGGSCGAYPQDCRAATRVWNRPGHLSDYNGFRVVVSGSK